MSTENWVILGVVIALVLYFITLYNALVSLKHNVTKAWANIDVLLKQRHDELPKLVAACKEVMKFEQDTLEKVIRARSSVASARQSGNVKAVGRAETSLRAGLGNLFALAESYPDLKSNESFQQLQSRISSLENTIADRRELYNETVNNNNVRIEQFPDVLIASRFNFKAADLLEFEEAQLKDVNISKLFN